MWLMHNPLSSNDKDKQIEFWPVLKINEKLIGLDLLLKLKEEKLGQQKQK